MLFILEKVVLCLKPRLIQRQLIHINHVKCTSNVPEYSAEDEVPDESWNITQIRQEGAKCVKVAILGLPNVGKSTLTNQLVCRPVCATSSKVQTTRANSDAVYTEGQAQLIIIDTPGLVTNRDFKKFQLESSFKSDVPKSLNKADIVGVVQDASHPFRGPIIDDRVLVLLKELPPTIPTVLILNKVDKVRKKQKLLSLVDTLTSEKFWPNFSDVFMVSALESDGVDDLRNYFLSAAKTRDWEYNNDTISNEPNEIIIERAVRAKFMDALPQELPYLLKIQTEYLGTLPDGTISAVVVVHTPSDRHSKMAMGKSGSRAKTVALMAEQELSQAFRTAVRVRIAVKFREDPGNLVKPKRWIKEPVF